MYVSPFSQFDEEFSARQEAQAECQKLEEKIKEFQTKMQALEAQVNAEKQTPLKLSLSPYNIRAKESVLRFQECF